MTAYKSAFNRPWHTSTQFETATRIAIGTATTDDVTSSVWCECCNNAENFVLSFFLDAPRPVRSMLNRIPGELAPQFGKVKTDGSYSYSVQIPCMISTPSHFAPNVWKNLSGAWADRFSADTLVYNTDYTISGNTITFPSALKGDVFSIEYETTLTPIPGLLKTFSIDRTAEYVLIKKFGKDHARVQQWAEQYGNHIIRQLEMLRKGDIDIPEFARVNLYSDWTEGTQGFVSIPIGRV
jgi:hypothetical protein